MGSPANIRKYIDFAIQADSHNALRRKGHQQAIWPPSFAFLPQCDSLSVLATGHLPGRHLVAPAGLYDPGTFGDVNSHSGRAKFEPVSTSLQGGIRFFLHLRPAPPTVCLTVSPASIKAEIRGFHVPHN
jgi:hypothetical protein